MKKNIMSFSISLVLLVGCGTTGTGTDSGNAQQPVRLNKVETVETKANDWYIRIVAEDTSNNMKTAGAQLGQLEVADAVTKHSLKAIAPFTRPFLDVVFKNPTNLPVGEYKSNFHTTTASDSWEFTVKSSDNAANMILSWRGLYVLTPYIDNEGRERYQEYRSRTNPLIPFMKLIDVSTGTEIPADNNGTAQVYTFNMAGQTSRVFQWVLQSTPVTNLAVLKQVQMFKSLKVQALRKDAKAKPDALKQKRLNTLDMMNPPKFEVLVK